MADHLLHLSAIIQTLEDNTHLVEALFFPEVSRYGADLKRLRKALERSARRVYEKLALSDLYRRHPAGAPEVWPVTLTLDPPPQAASWREPLELTFPVVRWNHGDEAHLAFVPALGIEVVAGRRDEIETLIPAHIRATLLRTKDATSLKRLVWLQRCRKVEVEGLSTTVTVSSPKEKAIADEGEEQKPSVLKEVGTDLTRETLAPARETDEIVRLLADALTGRNPKSVLLVGPAGVGKTAAMYELVRRRSDLSLGATPFWATSGSRLVAGMCGYGMWQERCQKLVREVSKQRAVLYLGNLIELMEVGKSEMNSTGIAGFLRPYLGRGEMLAVAECTPEQVPVIERQDPHLLDVFHQVAVTEPSPEKGKTILTKALGKGPLTPTALDTLDRLHRRYATYSAYPGRPLRFLKNLIKDAPSNGLLGPVEVTAAFSRETGLPLFLLDDAVRLDLETTRHWFRARVIGQPEAVDLIVDLLATVKAGLTRPRRPIASLLFIGPTGVGKTEMAKALAEFLFGDRQRLTRLDMSEYADPLAVSRLTGIFGRGGVLTARVREQPFSVILLDEFEKAHPLFFDQLLQVLGEGRLTDATGRLADFCNAVVIMTSNLGAESFQQGAFGFVRDGLARGLARDHFVEEVRTFVRPELYNRIDRIVSFAPLDEDTVLHIAGRQLALLQERDGIRFRQVDLRVNDEVSRYLAMKGYDPRYGARPLKRAIERELLAPLADKMNSYAAETALEVEVALPTNAGASLAIQVRARLDDAGRTVSALTASGLTEAAQRIGTLRRNCQDLERSPVVLELQNDLFRLEKLEKRLHRRTGKRPADVYSLARLPELRRLADALKSLTAGLVGLEDEALLTLYGKIASDPALFGPELEVLRQQWDELLLALYCLRFQNSAIVTLAVYSEDRDSLWDLTRAYAQVAQEAGGRVDVYTYLPNRVDAQEELIPGRQILNPDTRRWELWQRDWKGPLERRPVRYPQTYLAEPHAGVIGLGLSIRAVAAFPRFAPERGLHQLKGVKQTTRCLVHTSEETLTDYVPPEGIERRGAIGSQERQRTYDLEQGLAEDFLLKRKFTWPTRQLASVLALALGERLRYHMWESLKP
jgi:ATP-dependent Clp protease ATP-binding subunit ClpA